LPDWFKLPDATRRRAPLVIKISQPALAMHSHDVPGYKYQMDTTLTIAKTATVSEIVDRIAYHVDIAPDLELKNVVLNGHGEPGFLYLGIGMGAEHVKFFEKLRTKEIASIWIIACQVSKGTDLGPVCPVDNRNGPHFCSELAKASGCFVLAADAVQSIDFFDEVALRVLPDGYVDNYEGNLYRYSPAGGRKMIKSDGSDAYD
jgi:hypothetical protein